MPVRGYAFLSVCITANSHINGIIMSDEIKITPATLEDIIANQREMIALMQNDMLQSNMPINQRAITREEFAARWNLSPRYVSDLITDKVLPYVKLGRRCLRIPIPEADQALLSQFSGCTIKQIKTR